jgi:hypothetical protein
MPEESGVENNSASQQEKFYQGLRDQAEKTPNLRPEIKKTILGEKANQNLSLPIESSQNSTMPETVENVQQPPTREELLQKQAQVEKTRRDVIISKDQVIKDFIRKGAKKPVGTS